MELATPVQILSRADTVHPALRLRNRDDQALPLWADFGPIGGSSALFFLRTDLSQLFAGIAPPGLLSALCTGTVGGASLARHFHDLRRVVDDSGNNNKKAIVFSVTVLVVAEEDDGRPIIHHEFKDLQAFELPPLMLLDESLAARAPDGTTTTTLTPAAAAP